ncbi:MULTISPECIES: DUF1289 domain-containing protein [Oceanimonas]|uniref:DUF1289 domain-containing protein n=1 Tax=Oceanimonas smirnovii TaxID=264574 RepID=A0ABW7P1M7_9GAMM|nr:DUF1289 domain-containing protein [Oceanimonas sp. CAM02]MDV2856887.1 DUF1289 domain-containing protein [Oceanimonas sp. CAM02]
MSAVASPCIGYCKLNDDRVCAGCFRHVDEIAGWQEKPDTEKQTIIERCAERKQGFTQ